MNRSVSYTAFIASEIHFYTLNIDSQHLMSNFQIAFQ